jgi:hypothetical protein
MTNNTTKTDDDDDDNDNDDVYDNIDILQRTPASKYIYFLSERKKRLIIAIISKLESEMKKYYY